jgi:hypothetical protein
MDLGPLRQSTDARHLLAWLQSSGRNQEYDLFRQLLSQRNFAIFTD